MINKKYYGYIFLGVLGLFFYLYYFRHANVFEEIYHDEYKHVKSAFLRNNTTLGKIPEIKPAVTGGTLYGIVSEDYEPSTLPSKVDHIGYVFHYPEDRKQGGEVSINFLLASDDQGVIGISYTYAHSSNKLERSVYVIGKERLTEQDEIHEYIIENGIDLEPYYNKADDLLRNKVIPDWLRVYPSRFSKDNWGDVEVIDRYALELEEQEE